MADETQQLLHSAQILSQRLRPADLDTTLQNLTRAAVDLIPEVTYASMTLRRPRSIEAVAPTNDLLLALDMQQYALQEGPCYDAATDTPFLVSTHLEKDPRFPRYGVAAVEMGIHAQAAFRLFERGEVRAALNVYAERPGAFSSIDDFAALFTSHAAVAISFAYEVRGLEDALASRKVIGQAIGIVMERYQLTDERAFAFLTRLSQHRNVKLRFVAEELVAEAEGRAGGPTG